MLERKENPAVARPINQMASVVRHFLEDAAVPAELVEFAVVKAARALREAHWTPSRVRTHCTRVAAVEGALLERRALPERVRWLRTQLPVWLDGCLDD